MNEPLRLHALPMKTEGTPHVSNGAPAAPVMEGAKPTVPPAGGQGVDKRKKAKEGDAPSAGARKKILGSVDILNYIKLHMGSVHMGLQTQGEISWGNMWYIQILFGIVNIYRLDILTMVAPKHIIYKYYICFLETNDFEGVHLSWVPQEWDASWTSTSCSLDPYQIKFGPPGGQDVACASGAFEASRCTVQLASSFTPFQKWVTIWTIIFMWYQGILYLSNRVLSNMEHLCYNTMIYNIYIICFHAKAKVSRGMQMSWSGRSSNLRRWLWTRRTIEPCGDMWP